MNASLMGAWILWDDKTLLNQFYPQMDQPLVHPMNESLVYLTTDTPSTDFRSSLPSIFKLVLMVTPFALIFFAAVLGNLLVILTLALDKRMRTVTNAFLLNLAVADLLLGLFCMPFTLLGFIMRHFMFGQFMCKLVPYLQAVSVCVSSWTLVTMSVERYYAICHPFRSKSQRQTWSHVYKVIGAVWAVSLLLMLPIAHLSELQPTRETSKYKCRERWPSEHHLIVFTIFLDVSLFLIPLIVMIVAYTRIILHLRCLVDSTIDKFASNHELHASSNTPNNNDCHGDSHSVCDTTRRRASAYTLTTSTTAPLTPPLLNEPISEPCTPLPNGCCSSYTLSTSITNNPSLSTARLAGILHRPNSPARPPRHLLLLTQPTNSTNVCHILRECSCSDKSTRCTKCMDSVPSSPSPAFNCDKRKKVHLRSSVDRQAAEKRQSHVLRMLVMVVVEFFVCWTPLHVINLLSLYRPQVVYHAIGYDGLSILYWLAFLSTCTNPITYCFMNQRFRRSFRALFTCTRFHWSNKNSTNGIRIHSAQTSTSRL